MFLVTHQGYLYIYYDLMTKLIVCWTTMRRIKINIYYYAKKITYCLIGFTCNEYMRTRLSLQYCSQLMSNKRNPAYPVVFQPQYRALYENKEKAMFNRL